MVEKKLLLAFHIRRTRAKERLLHLIWCGSCDQGPGWSCPLANRVQGVNVDVIL